MTQDDAHLWTVARYIEANPLRAGVVADPAEYRWSSYPAHALRTADPLLSPMPEWDHLGKDEPSRRSAWRQKVLAALPDEELESIRRSVRGGRPFGDAGWVESMAASSAEAAERRPRVRPRKVVKDN